MKDPKDMLKDVNIYQKLLDLTLRHKKFNIPIIFSHVSTKYQHEILTLFDMNVYSAGKQTAI